METSIWLHGWQPEPYWGVVFFGTLLFYNIQRLSLSSQYSLEYPETRRGWILKEQKKIKLICWVGVMGTAWFMLHLSLLFQVVSGLLGLGSLAYFLPGLQLRNYLGVKAFMVALVWAMVTLVVPLLLIKEVKGHGLTELLHSINGWSVWGCLFFERLLFMLSLCIAFNIRDIEYDKSSGVRTMASVLGISTTKKTALLVLFVAWVCGLVGIVLWGCLGGVNKQTCTLALAMSASYVVSAFTLKNIRPDSTELYYLFRIDGLMLLHSAFICPVFLMLQ